jgi:hypothetical protein
MSAYSGSISFGLPVITSAVSNSSGRTPSLFCVFIFFTVSMVSG